HDTPNAAALNRLIAERVPGRELLARAPSVRMEEREVTLVLERELTPDEEPSWDLAARTIEEETGFRVGREVRRGTPGAAQTRDGNGRLEINLTYQRIRDAFAAAPNRPARVGLHPGP